MFSKFLTVLFIISFISLSRADQPTPKYHACNTHYECPSFQDNHSDTHNNGCLFLPGAQKGVCYHYKGADNVKDINYAYDTSN